MLGAQLKITQSRSGLGGMSQLGMTNLTAMTGIQREDTLLTITEERKNSDALLSQSSFGAVQELKENDSKARLMELSPGGNLQAININGVVSQVDDDQ